MSRHAAATRSTPGRWYDQLPPTRPEPTVATAQLPAVSPAQIPDLTVPAAAGPADLTGFQAQLWDAVTAALLEHGHPVDDAAAWAAVRAALPVARRSASQRALEAAADAADGSWVHAATLRALAVQEGQR